MRACTLPQIRPCTRAIFPLLFSLNFRRNPGETGLQDTARTASHTAGFVPCRFGAVLCGVISRLKIGVFNRDALPGRIYPRIHRKSLQAYFIIRFGYSGRSDPYPQSPGKLPVSLSLSVALAILHSGLMAMRAGFMEPPEGAGSGRGDRVDFYSRVRLETDTLAMPENRAALTGLNDRFHGRRVRIDYVRPNRCATWGMWG